MAGATKKIFRFADPAYFSSAISRSTIWSIVSSAFLVATLLLFVITEKAMWSPDSVVAYPEREYTWLRDPVLAWTTPAAAVFRKRSAKDPSVAATGRVSSKAFPQGC